MWASVWMISMGHMVQSGLQDQRPKRTPKTKRKWVVFMLWTLHYRDTVGVTVGDRETQPWIVNSLNARSDNLEPYVKENAKPSVSGLFYMNNMGWNQAFKGLRWTTYRPASSCAPSVFALTHIFHLPLRAGFTCISIEALLQSKHWPGGINSLIASISF